MLDEIARQAEARRMRRINEIPETGYRTLAQKEKDAADNPFMTGVVDPIFENMIAGAGLAGRTAADLYEYGVDNLPGYISDVAYARGFGDRARRKRDSADEDTLMAMPVRVESPLAESGAATTTTTTTTPVATKDTGGAGFGSMDSRIAQMLSNRQKEAESDKWMALAQTGMALMASKNPTFGGALGEAGLAGIGALQKSKQGARAFETDMLKLQTQLDIAQQRARSSGTKNIPATALNSAQADVESAQTRLLEARTDAERLSASRALKLAQGRYNQLTRMFDTQYGVPIANANGVGGTKNINLTST